MGNCCLCCTKCAENACSDGERFALIKNRGKVQHVELDHLISSRHTRRRWSIPRVDLPELDLSEVRRSAPRRESVRFSELNLTGLRMSKKFSSCATIFHGEQSPSNLDITITLRCIAKLCSIHMTERSQDFTPNLLTEICDERAHPMPLANLWVIDLAKLPSEQELFHFLMLVFSRARLPNPCSIVFVAYLERLFQRSLLDLNRTNWRWIFIGLGLLALKTWVDDAWWNEDYLWLLGIRSVPMGFFNELEMKLLLSLDFDVHVSRSEYTFYFYEILQAAEDTGLVSPWYEPLTQERAASLHLSVAERKRKRRSVRRSTSLDDLTFSENPMLAVLPF